MEDLLFDSIVFTIRYLKAKDDLLFNLFRLILIFGQDYEGLTKSIKKYSIDEIKRIGRPFER